MKKTISTIVLSLTALYVCTTFLKSDDLIIFRNTELYISNWMSSAIFLRVFYVALFCSAIITIFKNSFRFKIFTLILLILPLVDSLSYIFGEKSFGMMFYFSNPNVESYLLIFLIIISGILTFVFKNQSKPRKIKKWITVIIVVVGIGTSFIKPIYIDDWIAPKAVSNEKKELINELNIEFDIDQDENAIYAFFTTTCPFCKMAAVKLGINERNEKLPKTYIFFPSKKGDAENFLEENKLKNIQYFLVEDKTFLKYAGNSFPSIYFSNNENAYHWKGSEFNYRALDLISKK